jgi:hypothetical protein
VFVADLRHFLDMPDDAPGPARRMAEHLTLIVRAATSGDAGFEWVSGLPCRRRPGRTACPGHLAVFRADVPPTIDWRCTSCGDEGVIRGWERSPFDLRTRSAEQLPGDSLRVVVPPAVATTLRGLLLVDRAGERLVFRARLADDGIELAGDEEDLDALIDAVAAEAAQETDRRRRKRLDDAFAALEDAIARAERP